METKMKLAKYHVCHKCKRVRWTDPPNAQMETDLPTCGCIGQTIFSFEMVPRTYADAFSMARDRWEEYILLYQSQKRNQREFIQLADSYNVPETKWSKLTEEEWEILDNAITAVRFEDVSIDENDEMLLEDEAKRRGQI